MLRLLYRPSCTSSRRWPSLQPPCAGCAIRPIATALPERLGFTQLRFARRRSGFTPSRSAKCRPPRRWCDRRVAAIRSIDPGHDGDSDRRERARCSATRCAMPTCRTTCRERCAGSSTHDAGAGDRHGARDLAEPVSRLLRAPHPDPARERAHLGSLRSTSSALRGLFRDALACDVTIAAQTARTRSACALGIAAGAVHVTGNIKFDLEVPRTCVAPARTFAPSSRIGRCGSPAARTSARKTSCSMRTSACALRNDALLCSCHDIRIASML